MQEKLNPNKATERSLANLETVIAIYGPHFETWCHSKHCTLNAKEVGIMFSYREHRTHKAYARKHELHGKHVASVFAATVRKLNGLQAQHIFSKWLVLSYMQNASLGGVNYDLDKSMNPVSEYVVSLRLFEQFIKQNGAHSLPEGDQQTIQNITNDNYFNKQAIKRRSLSIHLYLTLD